MHCVIMFHFMIYFTVLFKFQVFGRLFFFFFEEIDRLNLNLHQGIESKRSWRRRWGDLYLTRYKGSLQLQLLRQMVFAEGQKNWQMKYDSLEEDPCMYGNLIVDRGDIGRWLGKGLLRKWFWDHWWSMWEKSRIVFLLHILMQKSFCMDLKVGGFKDLPGKKN